MRNFFIAFVVLVLVLVGLIFYKRFGSDISQKEEPIRLSYALDNMVHAAIMVACEADFFVNQGLNVDCLPMKGSEETVIALSTGQIDIASGGVPRFLEAIDRGAPLKVTNYFFLSPMLLMVRADSNIHTFDDLVGKTIGSRGGNVVNLPLYYALQQEGIDKDLIKFIFLDRSTQMLALTQQKIVDAVLITPRELSAYEKAGAVVHEAWAQSSYSTDLNPGTIMMSDKFLSQRPNDAQAFIRAFIQANEYIVEHPQESAELISQTIARNNIGGSSSPSLEEVLTFLKKGEVKFVLWQEPVLLEQMAELMFTLGFISKPLTIQEIFDLRFNDELKAAQLRIYGTKN